ncbi:hypothetical protein BC008_38005 [Mastigocoleus testarum BC008]|uniref:Uncharacterized protein n=1 Tax=Mastigocoleus testarum BC008 TaxID=371196 RepID=A0A0V7ZDS3_9CYAN|nr:hypothetical protein BC008_08355 [Mastigocoleus testarum BC008]KST62631.1 hypothetical protein BC008_38005 [Mastigocoleus testarum BC008]
MSQAISQAGAWITDFHLYSDILIYINSEIQTTNLDRFAETLQGKGLNLSQNSIGQLILAGDKTLKEKKLIGTLQIIFLHD